MLHTHTHIHIHTYIHISVDVSFECFITFLLLNLTKHYNTIIEVYFFDEPNNVIEFIFYPLPIPFPIESNSYSLKIHFGTKRVVNVYLAVFNTM